MYRISTNHCLNLIRNRTRRRQKLEDHGGEVKPQDSSETGVTPDHARLRVMLAEEDPETQAVIIHTFFDQCTRKETAELVGVSVPTVRKRIDTFITKARVEFGLPITLAALLLSAAIQAFRALGGLS